MPACLYVSVTILSILLNSFMFSKNTFVCARLVFMGGVTKHRTGRTAAGAVFRNIVHGRYGIIIIILLRATAYMLQHVYAIARPSVLLSVCPSDGGILEKRLK